MLTSSCQCRVGSENFDLVIWANVADEARSPVLSLAWSAFAPNYLRSVPADCKYCSPTESVGDSASVPTAFELQLHRMMMSTADEALDAYVVSKAVLDLVAMESAIATATDH